MNIEIMPPDRVIERLRSRIEIDRNGCWIWTGALYPTGYGHIAWADRPNHMVHRSTHRTMWLALKGPIPEGRDLDHLCRVRACCNPDHLEPVTRQTNLLRGETIPAARAAVTSCPQGHEYTEENTLLSKAGQRQCKECTYERNRAYYHSNKARRAEYNKAWREKRRAQSS